MSSLILEVKSSRGVSSPASSSSHSLTRPTSANTASRSPSVLEEEEVEERMR